MSTPLSDESSSSSATAAELRIRPCDDQDEDDVEVLLIESDDGEGTAKDDVEAIDVDSDNDVILVDSCTAVSTDQDSRAWRLHDPVVGNLKRLYDGNSNNLRSARDKLTRALKRQAWKPWIPSSSVESPRYKSLDLTKF